VFQTYPRGVEVFINTRRVVVSGKFQTYPRGVEVSVRQSEASRSWFQTYPRGVEVPSRCGGSHSSTVRFRRTLVGLKSVEQRHPADAQQGFRRTLVGLKCPVHALSHQFLAAVSDVPSWG